MSSSQSAVDCSAPATSADTTTTPVAISSLGKRKETPFTPPSLPSSSPTNAVVDAAFKRLFGYSWGTKFDLPQNDDDEQAPYSAKQQMVEIFGPARTARILNLPWNVIAPLSSDSKTTSMVDHYNPAALLTTKIVSADTFASSSAGTALKIDALTRMSKKMRFDEENYKNIALPNHMVSSSKSATVVSNLPDIQCSEPSSRATAALHDSQKHAGASVATSSNLDSVLSQIAGKKTMNTVEKSSNDWEGFKETDKTLQDEVERNAQSKNAYLVKQDFLSRVDHRKFELEKEERDRERSRRAVGS